VISADLGKVGQTRPGQVTSFQAVSTDAAVLALRELEQSIAETSITST
jgi:allophanate hydrolase subunit 2